MGELPNASLPQSYRGDRIMPEQASPFSSPSAHPNTNASLFQTPVWWLCMPYCCAPQQTVLFFLAGSRLANTMPPPAKQRVGGRIAVQAELANPSNEQ